MTIYRDIATKAELEREYSPSSCVGDLLVLLDQYRDRSIAARTVAPPTTLSYGSDAAETVDLFLAPESAAKPTVIYIHGGYWQELSKDEHSFPAPAFHRHGFNYVAVNYGLAPQAAMTEMIDRCRRAVAWLMEQGSSIGLDPCAFHLAGCSAGGHLAAMTGLTPFPRPICSLTLMSGVFDLRPIPLTYVNNAIGMSAEDALRFSPFLLVDTVDMVLPPALLVWGEHETSEFKRQSRDFAAALAQRGASVAQHEIAGRNHFDLIFDLGDETSEFGRLSLEMLRRG
jgi:arylformamidase